MLLKAFYLPQFSSENYICDFLKVIQKYITNIIQNVGLNSRNHAAAG